MDMSQMGDGKEHLRTSKPRKPLWNVTPDSYGDAVAWVREHLRKQFDIIAREARMDPEAEAWFFYDDTGEFVTKVPVDLMDRLAIALRQMEGK